QQEGFRYHARDLAILRGQIEQCPVLLGSATPALETLVHAQSGKYHHLKLTKRAGDARPPQLHLVNICRQELIEGFSGFLLDKMRQHLDQGHQVLLFLNRRGYAPLLLCHSCGATLDCPRCDAHTTYHRAFNELRCHHCGYHTSPPHHCPHCTEGQLRPLGLGTQKIETTLQGYFPDAPLIRIDRDSMSRKHALPEALTAIAQGDYRIIIGTQMLAKGHDFPNITLVGMIDVDQGLFSTDFRAQERLAQQILQVSGRAGRGKIPGEVVIQTHQPEHPLLQSLLTDRYEQISATLLQERQETTWPPFSHLALLRASAHKAGEVQQFLREACHYCHQINLAPLNILGPVAAPLARKAGRYRFQLLLRTSERKQLHLLLKQLLPALRKMKSGRKVRWSMDVDPVDLG
ncbi:MAG TPA: primosomal protein N', partial [Gammaproteobacteria bacterium]|nr:primosomal protein N' [Gammaproteobacteria bacterium]